MELTTALGRLLTDFKLREDFGRAPEAVARELGVASADLPALAAIDHEDLCRQADALINKRWYEVSKLLPATIETLGGDARELFRYYAAATWPEGHRRHGVDAVGFLRFLTLNKLAKPDASEWKRVRRLASE